MESHSPFSQTPQSGPALTKDAIGVGKHVYESHAKEWSVQYYSLAVPSHLAVVVCAPAEHTAVRHEGQVVEGTTGDGCNVDGSINLPEQQQYRRVQDAYWG